MTLLYFAAVRQSSGSWRTGRPVHVAQVLAVFLYWRGRAALARVHPLAHGAKSAGLVLADGERMNPTSARHRQRSLLYFPVHPGA